MHLTDQNGKTVRLDRKLGHGGEGEIYSVNGHADAVAKIYYAHSPERTEKLRVMVSTPPVDPTVNQGHVSICWPKALLFSQSHLCAGFLMHRLDYSRNVPVHQLYNPIDRQQVAPGFSWGYLLRTAANIASVVEAIHACRYVVGDLNESNFLVSDRALVTLVDCDSMQVPRADSGGFFHCPVGKPDFTPPELQGSDFRQSARTSGSDNFALGVLIFLLLMEGIHPFSGLWIGPGDPPDLETRIRTGDSPYGSSPRCAPMPVALPLDFLPATVKSLVTRCFAYGHQNPSSRPSPREWKESLCAIEGNLRTCKHNLRHVYPSHLSTCPWCERTTVLHGFDPFPLVSPQQPLQAKSFVQKTFRPGVPVQIPPPILHVVPQPQPTAIPPVAKPSGRGKKLAVVMGLAILGLIGWNVVNQIIQSVGPSVAAVQPTILEGKILGAVQPLAAVPVWLQQAVGGRPVSSQNYPPPSDFQITDRCAGEACGYQRRWRALKEVPLFSNWNDPQRERVYTLANRETVTALTGVWITKKPAVFEVQEPISISGEALQPGDLIYGFMYLGEDFMRGFFHGKVAEFMLDGPNNRHVMRKLRDYEAVLWVEMKTGTGAVGWTNDAAYPSFDGQSPSAGTSPFIAIGAGQEKDGLWDYELQLYSDDKGASVKIGDSVIPCPSQNGVQTVHTGFILRTGENNAVDLVADQGGELLAKTFILPGVTEPERQVDLQSNPVNSLPAISQPASAPSAATPTVGTVEIRTQPQGEIVLDGKTYGQSDNSGQFVLRDLPEGSHALLVRRDGFKDGQFTVTVTPGEYKHFFATLEPALGYLSIGVSPPGSTVTVEGQGGFVGGMTDRQWPVGSYSVTASRKGMKTETRTATVQAGQHAELNFALSPDPEYSRSKIAEANAQLARGDAQAAIQSANDLLSVAPDNLDALSLLTVAYFRADDTTHFQSAAVDALRRGGILSLQLMHEHEGLSGESMHPVTLDLTSKTITYDPGNAPCKYGRFTAPLTNIEIVEVSDKAVEGKIIGVVVRHLTPGTYLLHLDVRDPAKSNSKVSLYFALPESRIVKEGNGVNYLASKAGSAQLLGPVVNVIRQATGSSR